jgi:hypothetical protein
MKKYLGIVAIAAGAMLLTACGEKGSATEDVSAGGAKVDNIANRGGDEPVDCGEVEITDTITHTLIAVPTSTGTVGCTEAFNVLDEYLAIPAEDRELDGTPLSGGWACGTEDGETMLIICGSDNELAFHTQPIDEPLPADTVEPVECGDIDVTETITHTLIADPTPTGTVGCTEAFNVLDEYLAIPAEDRSASFENMPLSNGWACGTDDGAVMSIGCVKGGLDADYEFAFHTTPV